MLAGARQKVIGYLPQVTQKHALGDGSLLVRQLPFVMRVTAACDIRLGGERSVSDERQNTIQALLLSSSSEIHAYASDRVQHFARLVGDA